MSVRFNISTEEMWPDFDVVTENSIYFYPDEAVYEITDEEYADYRAACKAYNAWQDRLRTLCKWDERN